MRFPAEQERADVIQARELFMSGCEKEDQSEFIFLDESGLHLGMSSLYGRAKSAERVRSFDPFNKGKRTTMIAAISCEKVEAATVGEWHVDGDIFLSFIELCLVPTLRPGNIVIMDNLSTHKISGVRERIEAVGARLVYLPPYSPDLSPIELCWSKIKRMIRKKAPRTFEELKEVTSEAFKSIKTSDLEGWFTHCGYCTD
jgi:transposase